MMKASIVAFELSSLVKEQLEISAQRRRCIGEVSDGAEQKKVLYSALLHRCYTILYDSMLYYTTRHYNILYYTTVLYSSRRGYTILDYIIFYYTIY